MKKLISISKSIFLIWGGISLLGVIVVAGLIAYHFSFGNRSTSNTATSRDVGFVLNWSGLGEERIDKVVSSYESARTFFVGDHVDAYAIKVTRLDLKELTENSQDRWYRGDELPETVDGAVDYISGYLGWKEISWFPKTIELKSKEIYVYPWSINFHGVRPTAAQLIFVRPSDLMIFYISAKS